MCAILFSGGGFPPDKGGCMKKSVYVFAIFALAVLCAKGCEPTDDEEEQPSAEEVSAHPFPEELQKAYDAVSASRTALRSAKTAKASAERQRTRISTFNIPSENRSRADGEIRKTVELLNTLDTSLAVARSAYREARSARTETKRADTKETAQTASNKAIQARDKVVEAKNEVVNAQSRIQAVVNFIERLQQPQAGQTRPDNRHLANPSAL